MWYFAWILGLGLACAFGILNGMWYELVESRGQPEADPRDPPPP